MRRADLENFHNISQELTIRDRFGNKQLISTIELDIFQVWYTEVRRARAYIKIVQDENSKKIFHLEPPIKMKYIDYY